MHPHTNIDWYAEFICHKKKKKRNKKGFEYHFFIFCFYQFHTRRPSWAFAQRSRINRLANIRNDHLRIIHDSMRSTNELKQSGISSSKMKDLAVAQADDVGFFFVVYENCLTTSSFSIYTEKTMKLRWNFLLNSWCLNRPALERLLFILII